MSLVGKKGHSRRQFLKHMWGLVALPYLLFLFLMSKKHVAVTRPQTLVLSGGLDDGIHFKRIKSEDIAIPTTYEDNKIVRFQYNFRRLQGRFVKIVAENMGNCPDWHRGKGGRSWIFVDEIEVKTK